MKPKPHLLLAILELHFAIYNSSKAVHEKYLLGKHITFIKHIYINADIFVLKKPFANDVLRYLYLCRDCKFDSSGILFYEVIRE
ncbi:hypothetical protein [Campylobacter concisus]|uniref:hypothetical protein n=1 Tax=Campylobacter concisus TaxID=199 RepID=UPI0011E7B782|nr:hypothetical protein [Campylobacter concisus]